MSTKEGMPRMMSRKLYRSFNARAPVSSRGSLVLGRRSSNRRGRSSQRFSPHSFHEGHSQASGSWCSRSRQVQLLHVRSIRWHSNSHSELLKGLHKTGYRTNFGDDDSGFVFLALARGGGYYLGKTCSLARRSLSLSVAYQTSVHAKRSSMVRSKSRTTPRSNDSRRLV